MATERSSTAAQLQALLRHLARRHGLLVHGSLTRVSAASVDPRSEADGICVEWFAPLWMLRRSGLVDEAQAALAQQGQRVEWSDEACTRWRLYPTRSPGKPVHRLTAHHLIDDDADYTARPSDYWATEAGRWLRRKSPP